MSEPTIELLAPAGSPEALDAAVAEGADAVYLGLKTFNARLRSANFTYARFEAALRALRSRGKKLYVTVNTVFEQREADRMYQFLRYLSNIGPDAIIVQDLGVLTMARSQFPGLRLHASTQMNVASGMGCNALSRQGVSRVVLARELRLAEIEAIRGETNVELEVFVHGALCVGASGLCLFSSFLGGKSANRGMCAQACRRLYKSGDTESGFYFSPADLQLLGNLGALAGTGVNSVKIEGRMKSAEYVGTVVSAYRLALDAIAEGGEARIAGALEDAGRILRGDFARGKTVFYHNHTADGGASGGIDWLDPEQDGGTGIALGELLKVRGRDGERMGFVAGVNAAEAVPAEGDSIRLHRRDDTARVSHKLRATEPARESTPGGNVRGFWLSIPDGFDRGDRAYLIQTRGMSRRYRPVTSADARGSRGPGHEQAPVPMVRVSAEAASGRRGAGKGRTSSERTLFPEGLYVAVSRIEDLYVVQSSRPAKVLLRLTRHSAHRLIHAGETGTALPFRPADMILSLDPFFPQDTAEALAEAIPELVDLGYSQFAANNLGHFPLFREVRSAVRLIAGPWLYAFNSWALSFAASLGAEAFVSPFENNRQNLERTVGDDRRLRERFLVPVFAAPPLFHIRADLSRHYDFKAFSDSRDERFVLVGDPDGSMVFPEKPFSIIDKISFLQDAGFRRFLIDLSGVPVKKTDYKDLMRSVDRGIPLPDITRFNWKDGFFSAEPASK